MVEFISKKYLQRKMGEKMKEKNCVTGDWKQKVQFIFVWGLVIGVVLSFSKMQFLIGPVRIRVGW